MWWKESDSKYTRNNEDDSHGTGNKQDSKIICHDCKNPVPPDTLINGTKYSAEAITDMSKKKYGLELCYSCKRKRDNPHKNTVDGSATVSVQEIA